MRPFTRMSGLILVAACGPGSPGDGGSAEASGNGSTVAVSDSVVTGPQSATEATNADPTSGTTVPSGTTTTGTTEPVNTTTTSDTSSETSSGECERPYVDWVAEHLDCMVDWPTTTMVHGEGPASSLMPVTRVFFGVDYYACLPDGLTLGNLILDDPLMPAATIFESAACGPDQWIGEYDSVGELSGSKVPIKVTMTIDSFTGDWVNNKPVDPPRILGNFAGDLVGPFEAVHCAALDEAAWDCG